MDDWAEIRHLFAAGKHSNLEIGRIVSVSRETVDRAVESDRVPKYRRASGISSFDGFAPRVRELLVKTPTNLAAALSMRENLGLHDTITIKIEVRGGSIRVRQSKLVQGS